MVVEVEAVQETTQLGGSYVLWLGSASTPPLSLDANASEVQQAIEEELGVAVRAMPPSHVGPGGSNR